MLTGYQAEDADTMVPVNSESADAVAAPFYPAGVDVDLVTSSSSSSATGGGRDDTGIADSAGDTAVTVASGLQHTTPPDAASDLCLARSSVTELSQNGEGDFPE